MRAGAPRAPRRPAPCLFSATNHLLNQSRPPRAGTSRRFSLGPPRLDFRPLRSCQLSLATGVSADSLRRGFGPFLLLGDALGSLGIDVDAGPHRARQRDRADVAALRRGGLGADDLLDDGGVVLEQTALVEALLSDRQVDVGAAVGAVFELARLRVADGLGDVEGDGSRLRVRHLAPGPEDAAELSDRPHHVGRRHRDVEVVEALLDLLGEIGRADDVGTGVLGFLGLLTLREDGDPRVLAGPVRELERPAQLLLGMADVEAHVHVHLDRLVELGALLVLEKLDRLERRVRALAVDVREPLPVALAVVAHAGTSTPIERAVPSMILMAWSTSRAFKSSSLVSAIWRTWPRVSRPTFSRLGSPEPLGIPSASLISTAAGGVFVMNVKERSS